MKWRRAVAALGAFHFLALAVSYVVATSDEGWSALLFAIPPTLIGGIAAWWAIWGWSRSLAPTFVVAALWAMAGGAATFIVGFLVMLALPTVSPSVPAGLPGALAAPFGAAAAGIFAARWARRRPPAASRRPAPESPARRTPP